MALWRKRVPQAPHTRTAAQAAALLPVLKRAGAPSVWPDGGVFYQVVCMRRPTDIA